MKKVFVTGSNGFVGQHLIGELKKKNISFIAGNRSLYGNIIEQKNWKELFLDCDSVIHLAARVHVMNDQESDPLSAFRKANVEATLNIARAAKSAGLKRFIFLSSIKVNGEETTDVAFKADDRPAPQDAYGISKMEAEGELLKLHAPGEFEVSIIRPPLIYGPGVKANFEKLFWLVEKDLPIPFGRVKNKRSLVSVFNLCDLIIHCLDHPGAGGEIFLVRDDRDYSLRDIIEEMGKTLGKHPHLIPVPVGLMKTGAMLLGKKAYVNRLFGNLQVDIEKNKKSLNWYPKFSFQETYNIN